MKNFLMITLIVLIVGSMVLAILHISGIFVIKDFVLGKLRENPKTADWFKTHAEVTALSTQITDLSGTVSTKDLEIQQLQAQIKKLETAIQGKDSDTQALKEQIAALEDKLATQTINLKEMTEIYSKMDANKAATVLQGLDNDLIVQILKGLKKEIAAQIFSFFEPERAARITNIYTEWERE